MEEISKTRMFNGKRFSLHKAFVRKPEANRIKRQLQDEGWLVRIHEQAGEVHWFARYHVYRRRK